MEFTRSKYIEILAQRRHNGLIKVITGTRRSGKSYILNELYYKYLLSQNVKSSQIIKFAFDSDEDIDLLDGFFSDLPTIIKTDGVNIVNAKKFRAYISSIVNDSQDFYLLLDEVQLLENFTGTLNSYLRHKNFDIYVTASNSRFLSSDIATEFKGRSIEMHVLPLSFSEYSQAFNFTHEQIWSEYITTGGIPLVANMNSNNERYTYLKSLYQETYLKDIIERNKIRKTEELSDLFNILASIIGSPINTNKIVNSFKSVTGSTISNDTVYSYIKCFEEAFIISKSLKYNIKGRKYIASPYKIYFEDLGVRNARLNFRQLEETHLMENVLYNELRYRGFNVDVGQLDIRESTDRKDKNGKIIYASKSLEVDFIATKGDKKYYIQSALSINVLEKLRQEKRSLYGIDDSFEKILVTKDIIHTHKDEKGILTINLFDFLLAKDLI